MPLEPERRQALLATKLGVLVRDQWGGGERRPSPFPGGAAVQAESGAAGWVLVEDQQDRALGGALAWAGRAGVDELHVLVESPTAAGRLSRRAAAFARPPSVWLVDGRSVMAAPADPVPEEPPLPSGSAAFVDVIRDSGADPVVEHGVLRGEVLGLEVCRVVDGYLEVGVGKHDREAQALIHADRPPLDALSDAVAVVRRFRRMDAPVHPANQLALERWLRAVVMARPELVGLDGLEFAPAPSPSDRSDLRRPAPAPAVGDGVLVVCSTGIDTDLVPAAADAWLASDRPARHLLVVPTGDDHPVTRSLAAQLASPAHVITVGKDWQGAYPDS